MKSLGSRIRSFYLGQLRPWWREYQWPVVGLVVLGAFALTFLDRYLRTNSCAVAASAPGASLSGYWCFIQTLYATLETFGIGRVGLKDAGSWWLGTARWLLVFVALFAVGKAWAAIFHEQAQRLRLRLTSDHVVICGGGDKGLFLATAFRERGDSVVMIERDAASAPFQGSSNLGVITLIGDACDPQVLDRAGVGRAKYLLAVSGDDAINAEIAAQARARPSAKARLTCFAHIGDPALYHAFREQEFTTGGANGFRLQCFNIFEVGARALLCHHPVGGRSASTDPHAVIVGLGQLGQSLLVHLARQWWTDHRHSGAPLRVTIVDSAAQQKVESLRLRYPALHRSCILETHDLDVRSPAFERATFLQPHPDRAERTTVYFCLNDEVRSLAAALALRTSCRDRRMRIVVRVARDRGLAALLHPGAGVEREEEELHLFGLLPRTCRPDVILNGTNEVLAHASHEYYILEQMQAGGTVQALPNLVPWDQLDEDTRETNREQADDIVRKLSAVGCHIAPLTDWDAPLFNFSAEEVERLAIMEHDRWVTQKKRQGWTYAPQRDNERRHHPSLVAWETLPEQERKKDRDTVAKIPILLARGGFLIMRASVESLPAPR